MKYPKFSKFVLKNYYVWVVVCIFVLVIFLPIFSFLYFCVTLKDKVKESFIETWDETWGNIGLNWKAPFPRESYERAKKELV